MYELYNLYISRPDMYELYNSYMSPSEMRAAVKELCREALDGRLKLDDLKARCPAIVNVPITLAGRLNEREWHRSEDYATLLLDSLLLDVDAPSAGLVAVRDEYGEHPVDDPAVFERIIQERFPR